MTVKGTVHYKVHEHTALLVLDNPPVNPLSLGVRRGLHDAMSLALADDEITAIVLTGSHRAFTAGADLSEIAVPFESPGLHEVLALVESSGKPVIAAINGATLGGGLELALCCDHRIAVPQAALGLPEVKLGLLPGAGGTQRLPRLVGVEAALDLMLSGEPVLAPRAKALGLVDAVIEGDLIEAALGLARELAGKPSLRKLRDEPARLTTSHDRAAILAAAHKDAILAMPGRFALGMIVQCVKAALTAPDFETGARIERTCFRRCQEHPQHRALLHLFFAERECAKLPGVPSTVRPPTLETIALVGGGSLGASLAEGLARAGLSLTDPSTADVVIVAPTDALATRETLVVLGKLARPQALVVASEAGLDLEAWVKSIPRGERVVGLCASGSSDTVRVMEVIGGASTSSTALMVAMQLARRLGKLAVATSGGAIGERMRARQAQEHGRLLAEGATRSQIYDVLTRFGMRVVAPPAEVELEPHTHSGWSRRLDDDTVLWRCLYALVDEGLRLLEEGIASRASDVDIVQVYGHGFPDVAGGPLFWAESQGLAEVLAGIERLHAQHGSAWAPAPSLARLVAEGRGLAHPGA